MLPRNLIAICLGLLVALLSPTVLAGPAPDWYFGYTARDGRMAYTTDCAEAVSAIVHGCRAPLPDPVIDSLTVYPEWRQCQYVIRPGCLNGDTWENGVLYQTFGCGNASQLPDCGRPCCR